MGEGTKFGSNLEIFGSVLTKDELRVIRGVYFILTEFDIELVGPKERVHLPPLGRLGIYDEVLKADLRFFLYPFIVELMNTFLLSPSQIAPNSWLFVIGFLCLCLLRGLKPTVNLFRTCYTLKAHPKDKSWWYFFLRRGCQVVRGAPSSIHRWKRRFFFISSKQAWGFLTSWQPPCNG